MIPRTLALALAIAGSLALSGCGVLSDDADDGRVQVAASFYPLGFLVERIGGERVDVSVLTAPGQEPHDLELSVGQTAEVADADLVVTEQALQPVVADAARENATGTVLDVEDAVALDDGDPHFWLDPLRMTEMGLAVSEALAEVDPDHAAEYAGAASDLAQELTALHEDYLSGLADCERDTVVVSHDAFGYLARYGLDIRGIAGLSPESEPTPADLGALQQLIRDEGITTVFTETLAPAALSDTLADDAGVGTAVLDPIEGLTDETGDEDYLSIMRANLAALQEANGCR